MNITKYNENIIAKSLILLTYNKYNGFEGNRGIYNPLPIYYYIIYIIFIILIICIEKSRGYAFNGLFYFVIFFDI